MASLEQRLERLEHFRPDPERDGVLAALARLTLEELDELDDDELTDARAAGIVAAGLERFDRGLPPAPPGRRCVRERIPRPDGSFSAVFADVRWAPSDDGWIGVIDDTEDE